MSKIAIITAVFPPEPVVSAKTSYSVALGLTQKNHTVRVITNFPNRPAGKLFSGYKRALYSSETTHDGFRLTRCFSSLSKESSMLSRWLENISFGVTSMLALLFSARADVVYSNSWPIFASGFTALACKIRHIPLILSIQDMYPESLLTQGRLTSDHWVYRILFAIDRWIARQANGMIVLSADFARSYAQSRQLDPARLHVIPNWVDQDSITLMEKCVYRQEVGISADALVLVYGGNIGKAAGVDSLIDAMGQLHPHREVILLIAGSGSQLEVCQKKAAQTPHARILFHSPWNSDDTSKVLAAADILILPTQGTQSLASVPSKLLSYLLAARPVLAVVLPQSDTAQAITDAGCGWVTLPDDIVSLTQKIEEVIQLPPETLACMGIAGREYALNHFTTEKLLPKVIQTMEKAAQKPT